jgi:hypothetical protein
MQQNQPLQPPLKAIATANSLLLDLFHPQNNFRNGCNGIIGSHCNGVHSDIRHLLTNNNSTVKQW